MRNQRYVSEEEENNQNLKVCQKASIHVQGVNICPKWQIFTPALTTTVEIMDLEHCKSPSVHGNILGCCQEVEEEEHSGQCCHVRMLPKVVVHLEEGKH